MAKGIIETALEEYFSGETILTEGDIYISEVHKWRETLSKSEKCT